MDAGSGDCPPPAADQRGIGRPQGGDCDIGAYELEYSTPDQIVVTTPLDELNSDGDCSLREAIRAANTDALVDGCGAGSGPDNVSVPAGIYNLTIAGPGEDAATTGDLDITADLAISGAGAASTIIDAGGAGSLNDRVLHVVGGTVTVSGFTIRDGDPTGFHPSGSGAGVFNGGTLTLADSILSGNVTGPTTVGGSGFNSHGGGVWNEGTLTLTNSTVSGNTGQVHGGGIYNAGTVVAIDSTLHGNSANSVGGGIANPGTLTITRSTLSGNSAGDGGGVFNSGTINVTNSTVSGNGRQGIYTSNGGALTSVTISGNGASGVQHDSSPVPTAKNTIVANNSGAECNAALDSDGPNLDDDSTCFAEAGDVHADPLLDALADNGGPTMTHALLSGSPAIDSGTNTGCPATDQRGVARPLGPVCDLGAVEQKVPCQLTGTVLAIEVTAGGSVSLVRAGTAIAVSGAGACSGSPTVTNVQAIEVAGAAGNETLTIDLSAGAFAPGSPGGESGGIEEIEWDVDLGAGEDELVILGSSGVDTIRLGSLGVNLNTDNDADIVLVGAELVTVNGGTGADVDQWARRDRK